MKKIFIISPKNELSGSCVSILNLKKILENNNYKVSFITTEGKFLDGEHILENTEFNLIKILKNIFKLNYYFLKNKNGDFFIFNSILSFPYLLFFSKFSNKAIYIHELDLNPKWLYRLIIFFINILRFKVAVVNPFMLSIYKKSFLLPNSFPLVFKKYRNKNKKQILMIANCFLKKGIKDYILLSKKYPDFQFILLTQKEPYQKECISLLKNVPKNFIVEYDQSKKADLLCSSEFLLSLSLAKETFGLVLLEALKHGTLPITVINPGSLYCLNKNMNLIYERDYLLANFHIITEKLSKSYEKELLKNKLYIEKEFSNDKILQRFEKLIND